MKTFIAVHDAAQESIDPEGIGIRGPDIGGATKGHPDEIIDTVLAGSLSMVVAMLQADARQPVPEPQGAYSDRTRGRLLTHRISRSVCRERAMTHELIVLFTAWGTLVNLAVGFIVAYWIKSGSKGKGED